jgi:quercetin dioxygenase-like cupin family protein
MTEPKDLPYAIAGRHLIAKTTDLRVQILTLERGEEIPWHYHTEVTDTFICLDGPMVVMTPDADHELSPGRSLDVAPPTPHRVLGKDDGRCRFVIVQGVGRHDFIPFDA